MLQVQISSSGVRVCLYEHIMEQNHAVRRNHSDSFDNNHAHSAYYVSKTLNLLDLSCVRNRKLLICYVASIQVFNHPELILIRLIIDDQNNSFVFRKFLLECLFLLLFTIMLIISGQRADCLSFY